MAQKGLKNKQKWAWSSDTKQEGGQAGTRPTKLAAGGHTYQLPNHTADTWAWSHSSVDEGREQPVSGHWLLWKRGYFSQLLPSFPLAEMACLAPYGCSPKCACFPSLCYSKTEHCFPASHGQIQLCPHCWEVLPPLGRLQQLIKREMRECSSLHSPALQKSWGGTCPFTPLTVSVVVNTSHFFSDLCWDQTPQHFHSGKRY